MSENAELSRLVDEAGQRAGAGATVFSRLSRESIYRKFHMPYPGVPEWAVALFTGADEAQGECLVVTVAREEIVGHAMYARSEDGRSADLREEPKKMRRETRSSKS